ncbi:hypothetical protein K1719_042619 [Acacia pycnantha]|nr:hypothetical protein K1719_042619 [Acacia pycnantha]
MEDNENMELEEVALDFASKFRISNPILEYEMNPDPGLLGYIEAIYLEACDTQDTILHGYHGKKNELMEHIPFDILEFVNHMKRLVPDNVRVNLHGGRLRPSIGEQRNPLDPLQQILDRLNERLAMIQVLRKELREVQTRQNQDRERKYNNEEQEERKP